LAQIKYHKRFHVRKVVGLVARLRACRDMITAHGVPYLAELNSNLEALLVDTKD
jgi:hypothetical protein